MERARRAYRDLARRRRPATGRGCCAGSPTWWTSTREELALLELANSGHPIGNARWEAGDVRDVLHFYAAAPERNHGMQIPVPGGVDVTFQEPLGVVGVIVPWNFPMLIMTWGVAPALAAGNTVIVKPAEWTPLTALRLAELALAAGLPEGVLQVLPGAGEVAGARLVEHPDVAKIVFTGSTEVGKQIAAKAAAQVKRITLELGGKNANIDLRRLRPGEGGEDRAVCRLRQLRPGLLRPFADPGAGRGLRRVPGAAAAEAVPNVKVGDPLDESTEMGPLISAEHLDRVRGFVDGPPYLQGDCPQGKGFWFPPTVLTSAVTDRAFTEEIFGPVVSVVPFADEAEAVRIANDTRVRPERLHLDPRRRPGAAGGAGRGGGRAVGELALLASATGRRSAASSSPASAGSWARTPSRRSPRPRTSSSQRSDSTCSVCRTAWP